MNKQKLALWFRVISVILVLFGLLYVFFRIEGLTGTIWRAIGLGERIIRRHYDRLGYYTPVGWSCRFQTRRC